MKFTKLIATFVAVVALSLGATAVSQPFHFRHHKATVTTPPEEDVQRLSVLGSEEVCAVDREKTTWVYLVAPDPRVHGWHKISCKAFLEVSQGADVDTTPPSPRLNNAL